MKKLLLLLVIVAWACIPMNAQSDTSFACAPGTTLTDDIYWAHQPPQVQALRYLSPFDPTLEPMAVSLAMQGFLIDNVIMIEKWSPTCTMGIRIVDGYTWVPSLLQANVQVAPGIVTPGFETYNPNNPPPGYILVSINAADYPPYGSAISTPPAPQAALATIKNVVGPCHNGGSIGTICSPGPGGAHLQNGQVVWQAGVEYVAHVSVGVFGLSTTYLTPVAP